MEGSSKEGNGGSEKDGQTDSVDSMSMDSMSEDSTKGKIRSFSSNVDFFS
jgi:hypothetical protein